MKIAVTYCFIIGLLVMGCKNAKPYHQEIVENPAYFPNKIFESKEDLVSPKFAALKSKYQLDTIFHTETDEFKRIVLVRNWIKQQISIDNNGPYPGDESAESILDEAAKGHGFHCGHYMAVQNAIMNAYGYVTRCLGAGPGLAGGSRDHHGINEVWVNSLHKWVLSDAKYNVHFEKNGIPLSALEIRDEYLKNKAADIIAVRGPDKIPVTAVSENNKEVSAKTYTWIEWNRDNNKYINWPIDSSMMIVYNDQYAQNNKWMWDGKPHWAYNTRHMNLVADRHFIEWTPNTISSGVTIEGDKATIKLESDTPNFKSYQLKKMNAADWEDVSSPVQVYLTKDRNEFIFRTINLAGVTGPEHTIILSR